MDERQQLERAITALEAQRAVLGDAAVEAAIAGLRQQLTALQSAPASSPPAAHGRPAERVGERKLVTIVFADIAGFTALTEKLDPEAVRDLMNTCFARLTPVVEKYGGMIDKFIGDAIMALFGAPTTHENDAERALRAALEMMDTLNEFTARQAGLSSLGLHIGINTGHVVAGSIGTGEQRAYSVIGDAVNIAARLEELSQAGEILVGPDTYRAAGRLFEFEKLAPTQVKGKAESIVVHRLLGARALVGKGRGIAGLDSPLVGRQAEFQALQTVVERLMGGVGGVVTLVGEAGLGKSRLVAELHALSLDLSLDDTRPRLRWVEGRCLSYGSSIAYLPWLDVLRNLLDVRPDATPAAVHSALREHLQAVCIEGSDEIFPYLAKLLSLPLDDETEAKLAGLGAQGLKLATFQAVSTLIGRAAQLRPLVLVCEDLHWADLSSIELLEQMLPLADMTPLLIIAVMRPEREHACWRVVQAASQCEHHLDVQLEPLAPLESETLVSNLLRVQALPPAFFRRILQSAEGNPFYVEEIIRSLIDSGAIVYESDGGRWQATREVEEIVIPDTLQGVLAARIDRLQGETKRILQLASVIGRVFFYRVLQAITAALADAQAERDLDSHLATLQRQEMIRERARTPELEYIFKHQLTQEAAYNGLLKQERRAFHGQVAQALERLFPERMEEQIGLLAHHWEQAGNPDKAIPYLLRAGTQAAAAYANEEADAYFRRALTLLETYAGAQCHAWQLEALGKLGQLYFGIGKLVDAEERLRAAISLGREMGIAPSEQVRLYHWLAETMWWQGRYEEQIRLGEEGLALLGGQTESVEAALMLHHIASGYSSTAQPSLWHQYAYRTGGFLQRLPYTKELRPVYTNLGLVYAQDKDSAQGLAWLRSLEEQATACHDLCALGEAHRDAGVILGNYVGDLRGAVSHGRQAIELFIRIGDLKHAGMTMEEIAGFLIGLGDLPQAELCLDRALETALAIKDKFNAESAYNHKGLLALCRHDWDKAIQAFQAAIRIQEEIGMRRELAFTTFHLEQAYLAQGRPAEALHHLQQALAGADLESMKQSPFLSALSLGVLEQALPEPAAAGDFCHRFERELAVLPIAHRFLEGAEVSDAGKTLSFHDDFTSSVPGWSWHDPMGDCAFTVQNGLEIRASNGRDVWGANLSAPRLLRPACGSWAIQTACQSVSQPAGGEPLPAIGGLLVWKDKENYLRLDRGKLGKQDIAFMGCLANKDCIVGRGRLEAGEQIWLRMERNEDIISAYCSADGERWFSLGQVTFPVEDPLQVGVYAVGDIYRVIYHGAYPDGSAIRFTSFSVLTDSTS